MNPRTIRAMSTPAGWHPDPNDPSQVRYWDGQQWTEHRAARGAPAPTPLTEAPSGARKSNRSALLAVGAVVLLVGGCAIGAAAAGGGDDGEGSASATVTVTSTPESDPTATVTETLKPKITKTETVTAPPPPPKVAFEGDGTFLVGEDIKPGTYRNKDGGDCYWARLSGLSGEFDDLITNGNSGGQVVVAVAASDAALEVARCGSWSLVN